MCKDCITHTAPAGADTRTDEEDWKARALMPDDISDEMVRRGHAALMAQTGRPQSVAAVEAVLTAALTEPTRPEGLVTLIDTIREATYDPEPEATGEALYNAGVRVVTEEQP